ncbi:MAG: M20 family metallopeptidase [Rikenellaceae bacterium]
MENIKDTIKELSAEFEPRAIEIRRHLHSIAELSFEEHKTCEYISQKLAEAGIAFSRVASTGLIARLEGTLDSSDEVVVLRADIDALPIIETVDVSFASENKGVMHACGHDMHAATLLSTLIMLSTNLHLFKGTILGLFQPGEELCPGGASLVLKEHPFEGLNIKGFIGQHVDAAIKSGCVGLRAGQYMASSDELRITVNGRGGHAALPHTTIDPIVPAAKILLEVKAIAQQQNLPAPTIIAIGKVSAEGATNVIPSKTYMEGTMRTFSEPWRAEIKQQIKQIADRIASEHGATANVDIADGYPCVYNNPQVTEFAKGVMCSLWGAENVEDLDLRMTSEDFGFYTEYYPCLFYRLGVQYNDSRSCGVSHNSNFNPDESALKIGMSTFAVLAISLLNN